MTARFWIIHNSGFVKLSLKAGQSLMTVQGGLHSEGFWRIIVEWRNDGRGVERLRYEDGRDCDGGFEQSEESYVNLNCLRCVEPVYMDHCENILLPRWEFVDSEQRDEYAEAMGY